MINTNPDRINIDSDDDNNDDDDDTMTTDTPTAPTSNDNDDFIPLDTTETRPSLTTDTSDNRKRLHSDDKNTERTVIIKRRNASLYQSQDNDDDSNS